MAFTRHRGWPMVLFHLTAYCSWFLIPTPHSQLSTRDFSSGPDPWTYQGPWTDTSFSPTNFPVIFTNFLFPLWLIERCACISCQVNPDKRLLLSISFTSYLPFNLDFLYRDFIWNIALNQELAIDYPNTTFSFLSSYCSSCPASSKCGLLPLPLPFHHLLLLQLCFLLLPHHSRETSLLRFTHGFS